MYTASPGTPSDTSFTSSKHCDAGGGFANSAGASKYRAARVDVLVSIESIIKIANLDVEATF